MLAELRLQEPQQRDLFVGARRERGVAALGGDGMVARAVPEQHGLAESRARGDHDGVAARAGVGTCVQPRAFIIPDPLYKQFYWPDTNVLITRFLTPDGVTGQVTDYMPVGLPTDDPRRHQLVRWVQVVRGSMEFRLECRPAWSLEDCGERFPLLGAGHQE